MSKSWVLKLPRSDGDGHVLLQIISSSDSTLDLNIIATEGEAPYRGKIRQRKTTDLRAKNYHGSDDDWQNVLGHVFNPQATLPLPGDERKGLEAVAAVANGKVTITLRKRIDKITQKLGSVELVQDDDVEIQLFEWCASAIDQKSILEAEQNDLRSKHESAQSTIKSLEAKLEELVKAKTDYEEQLISKFVLLLNEKKLKIRNQQRLLSTAKVDQKKLQQMQHTLEEGKGRRAEPSRAGKRRADPPAEEAQSDSSDAFEEMDLDKRDGQVARSQEASSERHTTPETETATESDGEAQNESAHTRDSSKKKKKTNRPPPPARTSPQTRTKTPSPPPPVRQLPFAKPGVKAKKSVDVHPEPETDAEAGKGKATGTRATASSKPAANDSGEETASDDDEL